MNRREIKNRIAFKIWTAVTRVEKYNTCAAIQILVTICFISFRDDSFTRGQSPISVIGHWCILSYIYEVGRSTSLHLSVDLSFLPWPDNLTDLSHACNAHEPSDRPASHGIVNPEYIRPISLCYFFFNYCYSIWTTEPAITYKSQISKTNRN